MPERIILGKTQKFENFKRKQNIGKSPNCGRAVVVDYRKSRVGKPEGKKAENLGSA